ncbi:MAG: ATP-binding protein [Rhodocyclaceae bacterium]
MDLGRLFWKFFLLVWIAQMATIVAVGTSIWLRHRVQSDGPFVGGPMGGPGEPFLDAVAATLQHGGPPALKALLNDLKGPQVFALDESGQDLLGREIPQPELDRARSIPDSRPEPEGLRRVRAPDGNTYLLFAAADPHPDRGPPPPPRGRPMFPLEPIAGGVLASLFSAALLAWYIAKPIRNLRGAFGAVSAGNLDVRIGEAMGRRRDELADLGRAFDHMADRLTALMDAQRRLLHDVSHELRSPLARLQAATGLARQQPEKASACLERVERETARMDRLVGELLTLSRLEAGVTSGMDEQIDMEELLSCIVDDCRFEADAFGCTIAFQLGGIATVQGNAEMLRRAIENVVRNALKHSAASSSVEVEAQWEAGERRLRIAVRDRGPGVPEAELNAIFEPFFRGSGEKSGDGHGLGLAIAQRIVAAHGGTIEARNREEDGLSVDILLPAAALSRIDSGG